MKFLHLADLHLGKTLHNLSLIESGDQPYWVEQLLHWLDANRPDAVVIAGDVYDRGVPSKEAQSLLSDFLEGIAAKNIPVLLIAGNHDGGERLEFLRGLLSRQSIHIAGVPQRELTHVTLRDEFGPVTFWLMPYVFPAAVRDLQLTEEEIPDYETAVRVLLAAQDVDFTQRNVLIAHQNVLFGGKEPERSGSETSVGGLGGISTEVFEGFDYVALGHIHGAQRVGADHIRYAGAPLCYHFSEANQSKGPLLVTVGEKGAPIQAEQTRLAPLHRVRPTMTGTLAEIIAAETHSTATGEYIRVELTDAQPPLHARETLDELFRSHGCTLLDLVRRPVSRVGESVALAHSEQQERSMEELFDDYYRLYRNEDGMDEKEWRLVQLAAHQLTEGRETDPDRRAAALAALALKMEVEQ